jgi:hypothetical protein
MTPIEIAVSQLGIQEQPKNTNWGPDIKKYLNSVGINFPASWCAAFVYWCFKQSNPQTSLPKTGGVLAMWNKTPQANRKKEPQAGDIFIMDFGGGLGHTGVIEIVNGTTLHTIEGNSNDEGSREGYEVCRRRRKTTDPKIKGYIRIF